TPGSEHLPAEHVEQLRGRGQVADLDVVARGELEEALDARTRVLGTLALVAMRQEEYEARQAKPLVFRGDDELVDDDLGCVREVSDLRRPEDERIRTIETVAVLEAEDAGLRERAVMDLEATRAELRERSVLEPRRCIEQRRVAVREGPAPCVLPGDADHPVL